MKLQDELQAEVLTRYCNLVESRQALDECKRTLENDKRQLTKFLFHNGLTDCLKIDESALRRYLG